MTIRILAHAYLLLAVCGPLQAEETRAPRQFAKNVAHRAATLRPRPERLKWQRIPWMTNLAEGLKVAQQEGRAVFLWGSDDEPLGRC